MKILCLHCDYIKYKALRKAIKDHVPVAEKEEKKVDECLVVFITVEKSDENSPEAIVNGLVKNVREIAEQLKAENVVLYPYAHLAAQLASTQVSIKILEEGAKKLDKEFNVILAPFGWYKTFEIKCKGHPLAELSRSIEAEAGAEEEKPKEERAERKGDGVMKKLFIILPNGKIKKRNQLDIKKYENVETVIKDELGEREAGKEKPPHLKLMKQLEIAGPELRVGDSGNLRYLPKGYFMVDVLRELCYDIFVNRLGGVQVQTPCIISKEYKGAKWMMEKFPERLYKVLPGRIEKQQQFYLRPSDDYGAFSIFKDAIISYKNLPLGLYEYEFSSWRYEQRGELLGMYRIRSFIMHDIHTMCENLQEAFREFEKQTRDFAIGIYKELGFKPVAIILNCKNDFFEKYKENFIKLAKKTKKPIIVKLFSVMKTYKAAWIDVVAFDNLKRCMELTTVQLDTESPKYWDMTFIDKEGKRRYPIILHTGIGIDRTIAALLENAAAEKNPTLPLWLCPTQARVIPVSKKYLKFASQVAEKIKKEQIRVDVDDRNLHVEKKIREAEVEWVPFSIVIGEKEKKSKKLAVRARKTGKVKQFTTKQFVNIIEKEVKDYPFRPLPLPMLLSKRPKFV